SAQQQAERRQGFPPAGARALSLQFPRLSKGPEDDEREHQQRRAPDRRAANRRGLVRGDRGAVRDRVARAATRDRERGGGSGGHDASRRGVQAAELAVLVPGPGRGGAGAARGGESEDRAAG